MPFPPACPEIPVQRLEHALAYYRDKLGFTVDWSDETLGLAGLSQGDSRLFMASAEYRVPLGSRGPLVLWLNLSSRAEVDELHARWKEGGAIIASDPEAKPHRLYEFFARDIDGNFLRVFYDFGWEQAEEARGE
jgi:uncharacterized glyoxalase superfamily protein PhnB